MKAILVTRYGDSDVLQITEVPTPSPKDNEVLIKIHAAAVNFTDPIFRKGQPLISRLFTGLLKPKHPIPGDVLAGEVVQIGRNVTRFAIGDNIYGYTTDHLGAHAEYICLPEHSAITHMPENMNYEEAAGIVDGGHTALVFLRDRGKVVKKQKVLIYGASGSVGTAAVQIAMTYGAKVTGVCSTPNIEMIQSLGLERAIDYTQNDFTQEGITYDLIFDTVAKSSFKQCKNSLTENGVYLTTFPTPEVLFRGLIQSKGKGKRALFVAAGMRPIDEKVGNLQSLSELIKNNQIKTVISKRYSMDDVAEAHRYVESGHKIGNVVITVAN